jgi:UDP-N-acetylenolpyruvoylglucosamine reductase
VRPALPDGVVARAEEPLAAHTALRTGGACAWWVVVHRIGALGETLSALSAAGLKVQVLGAGTRSVSGDGRLDQAVIRLGTGFATIERGATWTVGAALPCPALAWAAAGAGRSGVEALARTPGSLGAALRLDDGPWWSHVTEVAVFSRGHVKWTDPSAARSSKMVVGARFSLIPEPPAVVAARTRAALHEARALPSWYDPLKRGSPGAELRRVDAPGVRLRGVLIPESAPEMVVNVGRGPATDLRLLHRSAVERVKTLRGVELKSAIRWTGRRS